MLNRDGLLTSPGSLDEAAAWFERIATRLLRGTRHIADFEAGRGVTDFAVYDDIDPKPPMLARMHGNWHARWVVP